MDCIEHIGNITQDSPPYSVLFLINPVDSPEWAERSTTWIYAFIVYCGIFGFIFTTLGLVSLFLLIKKDCLRLKNKTFLAIYSCLAIFGLSHGIHLALDPFGILGWLIQYFPQWTIISRCLSILGFPSLTASYMLICITLYKSLELSTSRLWHQDWRVVIPLVVVHYIVAFAAEIIANTASYPALISVLICEAAFASWGIFISITYLIAGKRVLHRLKKQCESCVRISSSVSASDRAAWKRARQESSTVLSHEHYNRQYNKIAQTIRKITIVTYFTSVFALLYALISITSLFFTSWFIFYQCLGLRDVGNPVFWFVLRVAVKTVETPLALIMLYSVTDMKAVVGTMMKFCCCCFPCKVDKECGSSNLNRPTAMTLTASHSSLASLGTQQVSTTDTLSTSTASNQHITPHILFIHSSTEDSLPTDSVV